MKAFMNKDLLTGALNADLNLNGSGMDIDDFKRSMSGNVNATINKGKINVGPGIAFNNIKVDMPFNNGKGDIKTGEMNGDVLSAQVTGWINLNNDTLDVTMTPTKAMPVDAIGSIVGLALPKGLSSGISAKVPFRIHGSLSKPTLDWAQSIGSILENLDADSLKQFDPKNIEENLKQGLQDQLDEALPGAGGLVEGLFGGKKNSGNKSSTTTTPTTTTTPSDNSESATVPATTESTTTTATPPAAQATEEPAKATDDKAVTPPAETTKPTEAPATTEATQPVETPAAAEPAKPAETAPAPVEEAKPAETVPAQAETPAPALEPAPAVEQPAQPAPAEQKQDPKPNLQDTLEDAAKDAAGQLLKGLGK